MQSINWKEMNWEKVGVYFAIIIGFFTIMTYTMDARERISRLEGIIEEIREEKIGGRT